jgi:hypothetical protein
MRRNLYALALIAIVLARSCAASKAQEWPGVWVEAEAGRGDVARKSVQYASGAWVTDWHEKGGLLDLDIDVAQPMHNAVLYLRYARDDARGAA